MKWSLLIFFFAALGLTGCASLSQEESLPIASKISTRGYYRVQFKDDSKQTFDICISPQGVLNNPAEVACKKAKVKSKQEASRSIASQSQTQFYRIRYYNNEGALLGETCYKNHFMVEPRTKGCSEAKVYERFFDKEVATKSFKLLHGTCFNNFNQIVDKSKCSSQS